MFPAKNWKGDLAAYSPDVQWLQLYGICVNISNKLLTSRLNTESFSFYPMFKRLASKYFKGIFGIFCSESILHTIHQGTVSPGIQPSQGDIKPQDIPASSQWHSHQGICQGRTQLWAAQVLNGAGFAAEVPPVSHKWGCCKRGFPRVFKYWQVKHAT